MQTLPSSIPTSGPVEIDPSQLTSIGGVILVSWALVAVLISAFKDVPGLKSIPILIYALVVSCTLCVLANKVLGTLPGDLPTLLTYTVISALSGSGLATWLKGKSLDGPKNAGG